MKYFINKALIAIILITLLSCTAANIQKKLIGRWEVTEAVFSTGDVLKNPDMVLEFSKTSYTVYTKGETNFTLDYQVKKDFIGYYIEAFVKGRRQGERISFLDDDTLQLEFSDYISGKALEVKYYLKRIKDE